jgi:hypothetical protein
MGDLFFSGNQKDNVGFCGLKRDSVVNAQFREIKRNSDD